MFCPNTRGLAGPPADVQDAHWRDTACLVRSGFENSHDVRVNIPINLFVVQRNSVLPEMDESLPRKRAQTAHNEIDDHAMVASRQLSGTCARACRYILTLTVDLVRRHESYPHIVASALPKVHH